jgi:hypothetical protein
VPQPDVESALERARRAAEVLETRLELETSPISGRTTVVVGQAYDIFDPLDEWYGAGLLADAPTE